MSEKNECTCAIAQDLMPLQLDGVCSEESRSFLTEHMQNCEKCRKIYEEMQTSISPETTNAGQSLKGFQQFMKKRSRKAALLTALIILVAAVVICSLYVGLWADKSHPLPLKLYDVTLQQTTDGYVFLDYDYEGTDYGYNGGIGSSYGPNENGLYIVYTCAYSSLIPERVDTGLRNLVTGYYYYEGQLYEAFGGTDGVSYTLNLHGPITEVRQGTKKDYRVIYRAGDAIPLCDEETEAYISQYLVNDIHYMRSWKEPESISLRPDEIRINADDAE